MNKYKKLKNPLVLLGCMLVSHSSYSYAVDAVDNDNYSSVKIQDVSFLKKIMDNGNSILDVAEHIGENRDYVITLPVNNGCLDPRLTLLSKDNSRHYEVSYNGPPAGKYEKFEIHTGTITKNDNILPVHYSVALSSTNQANGMQCATQEGDMPEIQVEVVDDIPDAKDGSKNLRIKNVSPQAITITNIAGPKDNLAITAEFNKDISIDSGEARDVVLKPGSICTSKNETSVYGLVISYKVGDVQSSNKFKVGIGYSCDWERERTSAELKAARYALAAKETATTTSAASSEITIDKSKDINGYLAYDPESKKYILNIKNTSGSGIDIKSISLAPGAVLKNLASTIASGSTYAIPLPLDTGNYGRHVVIKYYSYSVDNATTAKTTTVKTIRIPIAVNCCGVADSPLAGKSLVTAEPPMDIFSSILPPQDSSQPLTYREIYSPQDTVIGDDYTIHYKITNLGEDKVPLSISTPSSPIYREPAVENNCGDTLDSKSSCNIKLLIHPETVGDFSQKLKISEKLYIPISFTVDCIEGAGIIPPDLTSSRTDQLSRVVQVGEKVEHEFNFAANSPVLISDAIVKDEGFAGNGIRAAVKNELLDRSKCMPYSALDNAKYYGTAGYWKTDGSLSNGNSCFMPFSFIPETKGVVRKELLVLYKDSKGHEQFIKQPILLYVSTDKYEGNYKKAYLEGLSQKDIDALALANKEIEGKSQSEKDALILANRQKYLPPKVIQEQNTSAAIKADVEKTVTAGMKTLFDSLISEGKFSLAKLKTLKADVTEIVCLGDKNYENQLDSKLPLTETTPRDYTSASLDLNAYVKKVAVDTAVDEIISRTNGLSDRIQVQREDIYAHNYKDVPAFLVNLISDMDKWDGAKVIDDADINAETIKTAVDQAKKDLNLLGKHVFDDQKSEVDTLIDNLKTLQENTDIAKFNQMFTDLQAEALQNSVAAKAKIPALQEKLRLALETAKTSMQGLGVLVDKDQKTFSQNVLLDKRPLFLNDLAAIEQLIGKVSEYDIALGKLIAAKNSYQEDQEKAFSAVDQYRFPNATSMINGISRDERYHTSKLWSGFPDINNNISGQVSDRINQLVVSKNSTREALHTSYLTKTANEIISEAKNEVSTQVQQALSLAKEGKFSELEERLVDIVKEKKASYKAKLEEKLGWKNAQDFVNDLNTGIESAANGEIDAAKNLKITVANLDGNISSLEVRIKKHDYDTLVSEKGIHNDLEAISSDITRWEGTDQTIDGYKQILQLKGRISYFDYTIFGLQKLKIDKLIYNFARLQKIDDVARSTFETELKSIKSSVARYLIPGLKTRLEQDLAEAKTSMLVLGILTKTLKDQDTFSVDPNVEKNKFETDISSVKKLIGEVEGYSENLKAIEDANKKVQTALSVFAKDVDFTKLRDDLNNIATNVAEAYKQKRTALTIKYGTLDSSFVDIDFTKVKTKVEEAANDIIEAIKTANANVERVAARIKGYDFDTHDSEKSVSECLEEFAFEHNQLSTKIHDCIVKTDKLWITTKEGSGLYYDKIVKPLVDRVKKLEVDFAALQGISNTAVEKFKSEFTTIKSATSSDPAKAQKDIQLLSSKLAQAKLLAQGTKDTLIKDSLLASVNFNDDAFNKDVVAFDTFTAEVNAFKQKLDGYFVAKEKYKKDSDNFAADIKAYKFNTAKTLADKMKADTDYKATSLNIGLSDIIDTQSIDKKMESVDKLLVDLNALKDAKEKHDASYSNLLSNKNETIRQNLTNLGLCNWYCHKVEYVLDEFMKDK